MNPSKPDQFDDDDDNQIRRLVALAGDPTAAPRPEFVAGLRMRVLDQLGPPRRGSRWQPRLVIGSALAAAVVAASVLAVVLLRPANAWAEVARALQAKSWVHTKTLGSDGKVYNEAWSSPTNSISASRRGDASEYHDLALRIVMKYVPADGAIYRLRASPELPKQDPDFFRDLLETKGPAKSPFPGMDLVAQRRREVVENGRAWVDIELTLKVIGGDRKQDLTFRVDPVTKLPHSCVFQSIEGPIGTTLFDYPDRGPTDLYDLGVPRTAKVVDRLPADDLDAVLAGLKAGRVRFDDYRAIMEWGGHDIKRVYRKGRKWRAELMLPSRKPGPQFPPNADTAWWKAHQNDYMFMVQAICDGERVYYYGPEGTSFMPDAKGPPRPKLLMEQAINPSDDPFMPWPDLFAEHVGHPAVWLPTDDREFTLEAKPTDGPPETIRIRVRDSHLPENQPPDLYKLWIDPKQNYLALRAESSVFEPTADRPRKLAYIDTKVIESVARSPGGHWYPTRVVRKTSNSEVQQVSRYLLEFDAALPDELFKPLKL